ncbi:MULTISPECIES: RHS domain-containing protein [Pseudomonas]|jgi:hypothetical protein|uniref:RHS domain-containing protein n=1 Tax=Pseudomonas qingdaonensis TaxID=2056231 RepID=A0ABX8DK79_9PSED|nr:RHS domain-containing protein [Pseudomonas qingdaonensis]
MQPQAFDAIAWYQCDHLGPTKELTDNKGEVAWAVQYKAWGEVHEERSAWARKVGLGNAPRFRGSITTVRPGCITTGIGTMIRGRAI